MIGKLVRICAIAPEEEKAREEELRSLESRLACVSSIARKLFLAIGELALAKHREERAEGVAYLPELHDTCGLDVIEMVSLLSELQSANLVTIEGAYPFENVAIAHDARAGLTLLALFSQLEKVPLRHIVVDLKFDSLD